MLQLREDQIKRLDAKAVSVGASRSKLVRDAVDAIFATPVNDDVAELYARAYPEPSFGTDDWGDLDAWHPTSASRASALSTADRSGRCELDEQVG
jgi:hypothetical protein